jgi:hypothetical protein
LIKAKMTGSSLEIAKAVGGTVQQATDLMENTMLPNVGPEAKVVGSAFALQANKISAPIEDGWLWVKAPVPRCKQRNSCIEKLTLKLKITE